MIGANDAVAGKPYDVIRIVSSETGKRKGSNIEAVQAMMREASDIGADAVLDVSLLHSVDRRGLTWYHARGTAVKFVQLQP